MTMVISSYLLLKLSFSSAHGKITILSDTIFFISKGIYRCPTPSTSPWKNRFHPTTNNSIRHEILHSAHKLVDAQAFQVHSGRMNSLPFHATASWCGSINNPSGALEEEEEDWAVAAMKAAHVVGEGCSWGHEAVGDEVRKKSYLAAMISMALVEKLAQKKNWKRAKNSEDPIRRLIFLGPWSHT